MAIVESITDAESANSAYPKLRERYETVGISGSVLKAACDSGPHEGAEGAKAAWVSFICYLHDHSEPTATDKLTQHRIATAEGTLSLIEWLETLADHKRGASPEDLWLAHANELEVSGGETLFRVK